MYFIEDWTGKICFNSLEFKTFEDAEEFLTAQLDDYDTDRQEYYIMERILC